MGMAYARNLIKAGFEVTGSDVVPERLDLLAGIGGIPAGSGAEVASRCEVVLTALPTVSSFDTALSGAEGIVAGSHPGLTLVEMRTFPLEIKDRGRKALSDDGAAMLDAPVSGTGLQAESAGIVIYARWRSRRYRQGSPLSSLRYPKPHPTSVNSAIARR